MWCPLFFFFFLLYSCSPIFSTVLPISLASLSRLEGSLSPFPQSLVRIDVLCHGISITQIMRLFSFFFLFLFFFYKHHLHQFRRDYLPLHLYGLERYHVCVPLISAEWCEMASRQTDNPLWARSVCHYRGTQLLSVCCYCCCYAGQEKLIIICVHSSGQQALGSVWR